LKDLFILCKYLAALKAQGKIMKPALALTALMTAASAAYAEPPSIATNEQMEYSIYFIGSSSSEANNVFHADRGLRDEATNVTCEWAATGKVLDQDKMLVTAHFDKMTCEQTEAAPQEWNGGYQYPSSSYDRNVTYNPVKRMVIEVSTKPANEINVTSTYRREWNFATGKVCLSQTEGQILPNGTMNTYMDNKMGCFAIPNTFHAWLLEKNLDLS
jgi:hypothetical protein